MTFTEAAAQVLRLVGKPLHYKEITDVAIERNLLSHVGKSPEVTMGARLAAVVQKGEKDKALVRVRPGVFALSEWDEATVKKGLADRTPALERIAQGSNGAADDSDLHDVEASNGGGAEPGAAEPRYSADEEDQPEMDAEEKERAEIAAGASEVFEAEEDDDEPILGSTEAEDEARADDRSDGNRRRRRRRRRGRGGGEGTQGGLPTYTVSEAPTEAAERKEVAHAPNGEASLDELAGADAADAVVALLGRRSGLVSMRQLAETARRHRRVAGDVQQAQSLLNAAMRADNLRRAAKGLRPRFRLSGSRVGLTSALLDDEVAQLETHALTAVERCREAAHRSLLRRLQDLPTRGCGELVLVLLERMGMKGLEIVKRPGAHGAELHVAAVATGPAGDVRTAVVVRRDAREIGRERVTELRGALHHYGAAAAGCIVTTGQILSGAREEAAITNAAPVTLIDGLTLAKLCDEHGVGVVHTRVTLPVPDVELLDALRSS